MTLKQANKVADRINKTTEHSALIEGSYLDGYQVAVHSTTASGGLIETITEPDAD